LAKKKVNVRRDYDLEARDVVVYKKSMIPRKMQFVILRGPGLIERESIAENEVIKKLSARRQVKIKIFHAVTVEDFLKALIDANVWASGIVFDQGSLIDDEKLIQNRVKKLLIQVIDVKVVGCSVSKGFEMLLA
jgi:hypothetical protein